MCPAGLRRSGRCRGSEGFILSSYYREGFFLRDTSSCSFLLLHKLVMCKSIPLDHASKGQAFRCNLQKNVNFSKRFFYIYIQKKKMWSGSLCRTYCLNASVVGSYQYARMNEWCFEITATEYNDLNLILVRNLVLGGWNYWLKQWRLIFIFWLRQCLFHARNMDKL